MEPVRTSDTNVIFTRKDCADLPAQKTVSADGTPVIITVWKPTDEERDILAVDGMIMLVIWGEEHPPVSIGVAINGNSPG